MIVMAALSGAICGMVIIYTMHSNGMLAQNGAAAMLLAAIASFYPVFAVASGDPLAILLHVAVFVTFAVLSVRAYHRGLHLIAGGLIAHGFFDISVGVIHVTGPLWWPAFCATRDIISGVLILRLMQTGKLSQ